MSFLQNTRLIRELMAEDLDGHVGDIALLKSDMVRLDARADLRPQLAPVAGWLPRLDLGRLRAMREGSFGRAYVAFLDQYGLSPFVITDRVDPEIVRRNAYGIRYATTHDMFHVLLGFGPDWVGEMGVLAFTVGQGYNRVLWLQAFFAWLIYPIRTGFQLGALREAWRRGYAIGQRAPFLLGVRLEDRFEDDLDALRRELRIAE